MIPRAHQAALRALLLRRAGLPLAQEGWPAEATMELTARAASMEIDSGLKRLRAEPSAALATRAWWVRGRVGA
ncbi:hypothetical protein L6R46_26380 [Myxococcota bacterium]|nr:hypothetical protein [Myxococcota bacterium]